jgi:hypothetical protein
LISIIHHSFLEMLKSKQSSLTGFAWQISNYLYGMKRMLLSVFISLLCHKNFAQHCPWDCSGMLLVNTSVSKVTIYKLKPVLVDEAKRPIVDTLYGTDKPTYDRCNLLFYDDFTKQRSEKIAVHHFYEYDTFYHFATGNYIVKYNFCEYQDKKLYLRYSDPYSSSDVYHYIEIPQNIRIHLHDYNNQLRERKTEEIKNDLKTSILIMDCDKWKLRKQDCR